MSKPDDGADFFFSLCVAAAIISLTLAISSLKARVAKLEQSNQPAVSTEHK